MQKIVDRQGWISAAYHKGGTTLKKSYVVWIMGSPWYYLLWVFKLQIRHPMQAYTLNSCNVCKKTEENIPQLSLSLLITVCVRKTTLSRTNVVNLFSCPLGDCISSANDDTTTLISYIRYASTSLYHRLTCHLSDANTIHIHIDKHILHNHDTPTNIRK